MTLKACLLTLASFSVLAAGATVAWPSFADSSNSTTSSGSLRLLVSDSANRSNARGLGGCSFERARLPSSRIVRTVSVR